MRSVVLLAIVALLCGCAVAPASRTSGKMLTIRPPKGEANAHVKPYTVPWPQGSDGTLLSGETIVLALVGKDGTVESIRVESTSGVPALDLAAAESVHRWHFTPATRNGVAVKAYVRIPVMMDPTRSWVGPEPVSPSLTRLPSSRPPWGQLTPSKSSEGSQ
ncbi:energy transducer TonB [Dyella soli]|uniref:Energy transducer TonB n=1 Tax=Dyella soli TaxID=522319 RepID=A0A4R0YGH5_9GAMM|nr:energy transducer TonB [Dyella soli]TCI07334.1 energy transducer TonB [Dyella soli]